MDGSVILFGTLPGGSQFQMNLGMTLVHEAGAPPLPSQCTHSFCAALIWRQDRQIIEAPSDERSCAHAVCKSSKLGMPPFRLSLLTPLL